MNAYRVDMKYIFNGYCLVRANSGIEAMRKIERDFGGMTAGPIHHGAINEKDVDWEFPMHPKLTIEWVEKYENENQKG